MYSDALIQHLNGYTSFLAWACRLGRLLTQLYAHGNVASIISFFVCQIVAGSVRPDTQCIFYAHAWVDLPLTLMVTGVSVSLAFLFMPRLPGKSNPYLQVGQMLGHIYHIAKHRSDIDMRGTGVLHKSVLEAHLA